MAAAFAALAQALVARREETLAHEAAGRAQTLDDRAASWRAGAAVAALRGDVSLAQTCDALRWLSPIVARHG